MHAHAIASDYDKAKMAARLCQERYGEDAATVRARYLYVGDSPNDQAGFAFFAHAVGVANVVRYRERLAPPPRYLARGAGGHGFAEVARVILGLRRG